MSRHNCCIRHKNAFSHLLLLLLLSRHIAKMKCSSYQFVCVVIHVVTSSHFICLISATCAMPGPIPNTITTLSSQTLDTGSYITWECSDGYMMDGLTNTVLSVCLEDGSWMVHQPICTAIKCPSPPIAAYSRLDPLLLEDPVVNQTISYTCSNSEYTLLGRNLNRCLQDGTWENDPPVCQRKCDTADTRRYTDLICFRTSDTQRTWEDSFDFCYDNGELLVTVNDVEMQNFIAQLTEENLGSAAWVWIGAREGLDWKWRQSDTYIDRFFWEIAYPDQSSGDCIGLSYQSNSGEFAWSPRSPGDEIGLLCQYRIPACGDPGEPLHGNRLPDDRTTYSVDATLQFTCQEGYTLSGESILRCMNDGAWNHQRPSCEAVECEGSPPEVALASTMILGSVYQDIALYTCQVSYIPDSEPISFCQHIGTWSTPNLTCKERQCWNATVETVFGQARLPMTDVGIVIDSEELCPDVDSEGLAAPIIRAVCQVSSDGETYWNSSIRCQENITRELRRILMNGIYEANVTDVAEEVFTITQNYEEIEDEDIGLLYEILQLIRSPNPDANVTGLIVEIVNNVMFVDEDVLASAQENGNYTTLIVQVLESQLNTVEVGNSTLAATYPNIAVQVLDVPSDTAGNGIVVTILSMDTGNLSNSAIMVGTHQDDPNDSVPRDTFARVVVPIEVAQVFTTQEFTEGPSSSNYTTNGDNHGTTTASGVSSGPVKMVDESAIESLRVSFVVYANDVMFPSPSLALLNREINTPVVSLTIGGQKIEDLMERVNITFYRFEPDSSDPTCTFWEFNLGKWSVEGCQLLPDNTVNSSSNEYYTCACDHLTSFAVLVNIHVDAVPPKSALRILSIIGCAISCLCLVIAIASYLTIKNIHQSTKIFICLCTTLLCFYTVSLAIIALDTKFQHAEVELIPCTVLATLVHYFVLSSLTWMGIEGFSLAIIKRIDNHISMTKVSIVGWGIPAVIVAVTGGITRNYYAVKDYCYIRKWPLIGGLLIPMAIILIINITVFILAMCRVEKSVRTSGRVKKDRKTERHDTLKRIQNGIAMLILLGCTWTTGYLALINVDYTELLFIIFNSLQGFFIFVLYCLRNTEIRKNWRRCICSRLLRKGGRWSPKEVPDEHQ